MRKTKLPIAPIACAAAAIGDAQTTITCDDRPVQHVAGKIVAGGLDGAGPRVARVYVDGDRTPEAAVSFHLRRGEMTALFRVWNDKPRHSRPECCTSARVS